MRFIATADWQLGMTAHFLDEQARARYHQARLDAVTEIGDLARRHDAAFVVVAGDVFESNQLRRSILMQAFEALRACPVPVVLLPGNHDPLDAASIYKDPAFVTNCPSHVIVLTDSSPVAVAPGVEILGAPWFSKRPETDLVAQALAAIEPPSPGTYRVLVGHGAVASLSPNRDSLDAIDDAALSNSLDAGDIHFAVLGDRHSTTQVAPRVWYPGSPEVTSRREVDPGQVLLVDLATAAVTPLRTGQWKFQVIAQDLNSAADVSALLSQLDDIDAKARTAVWLQLQGSLSITEHARLEDALAQREPLFARLGLWQRHSHLVVVPKELDEADLPLTGFAKAAYAELKAASRDDAEARDALGLLFRLVGRKP